jgi:hypothetical protein
MALGTSDASETCLKPPTGQELLNGAHDNRPQGPGTRFETFLVRPEIAVEMVLKQPVGSGSFGASRTIDRGRVRDARILR